jgi:hypothetical protein
MIAASQFGMEKKVGYCPELEEAGGRLKSIIRELIQRVWHTAIGLF